MANNRNNSRNGNKPRPWGYASAILPAGNDGGDDRFVRLCPVWQNRDGSFSLQLDLAPVAWNDPQQPRRLILQKARDDQ